MVIEGRIAADPDRPGHWCIAGMRRDSNADGVVVAELEVSRSLEAGDPLEWDHGRFDLATGTTSPSKNVVRGRVAFFGGRYVFEVPGAHLALATLEELSQRNEIVRQVRG